MDLVIDHSVQVDVAGVSNALAINMQREFERNSERFGFLKWGAKAFDNMLVVPPGSGIVHQASPRRPSLALLRLVSCAMAPGIPFQPHSRHLETSPLNVFPQCR